MIDSTKRTFSKAISWKTSGFLILSALAYIITGSLKDTSIIAAVYHVIMLIFYYFHEKIWNRILWGKTSGLFIQMTGLSGSGKTTIARDVEKRLKNRGLKVEIIDGDEYREGICSDLTFSKEDRNTNIRRLGFVGKVLARNNVVIIMSTINPYDNIRKELKEIHGARTIFIDCSIEECIERDIKGLYKKALLGEIKNFTGISDPFEVPKDADLVIKTDKLNIKKSAELLEKFILKQI
jgi:adenylylsulfate kinase